MSARKKLYDMNEREKKHFSLSARVYHMTLVGTFLIGLVALLIGTGLYASAMSAKYVSNSFNMARTAGIFLEQTVDVESYASRVMETYRSQGGYEAGHGRRFTFLETDPAYSASLSVLGNFGTSNTGRQSDVDAIYLASYDAENSALVYLADPDAGGGRLYPGQWDRADEKSFKKFMSWNGEGMLYDISRTEAYGWLCTSAWPVYADDGSTAAFVLADVSLEDMRRGILGFCLRYAVIILVFTNALGVLYALRMKKAIVRPVNSIASAAEAYVSDRKAGISSTNHFESAVVYSGNEIENLGLVMSSMERDIAEYEKNLTAVTAEKERISTELSLATRIQADMLPNIYPPFPDRSEFDIYASMTPAREVGGDFYDYFLIDPDHLCMVMADVSGKGVPAALFMMASKIILANNAVMFRSPARILEAANDLICQNNHEEMFVTVWLGILEISSGTVIAANAGHEYPAVMHSPGNFELLRDRHGLVVGGMSGMKYTDYEIRMEKGSKLFLYTDGVPEATRADGSLFGLQRMVDVLNGGKDLSPKETVEHIRKGVDEFVQEAEQFDDLTMMCLEYRGTEAGHV